ncbi:hypothetical protein CHCC20369_0032 [Bacillus licheniformis]|nr:hypothetical protein CHCC20487_0881 [Bacillus licheniformis]TWK28685.1 hypothetical protein CHCC20369_0032 [Bacillus licheniformis]TWK43738.1 hypothetical protein CHCC20368_3631 [Bacillus licheniformis]
MTLTYPLPFSQDCNFSEKSIEGISFFFMVIILQKTSILDNNNLTTLYFGFFDLIIMIHFHS